MSLLLGLMHTDIAKPRLSFRRMIPSCVTKFPPSGRKVPVVRLIRETEDQGRIRLQLYLLRSYSGATDTVILIVLPAALQFIPTFSSPSHSTSAINPPRCTRPRSVSG